MKLLFSLLYAHGAHITQLCTRETVICYVSLRYVVTLSDCVTLLHYFIALPYSFALLRYVTFDQPIHSHNYPRPFYSQFINQIRDNGVMRKLHAQ